MNSDEVTSSSKTTNIVHATQNEVAVPSKTNDALNDNVANKYRRRDSPEPGHKHGMGDTIAKHYNELEEKGRKHRQESRIYFMRNFNNWTKSMLIQEYVGKLQSKRPDLAMTSGYKGRFGLKVLDIGCGKGGDLIKWSKAPIHNLCGVDIAQQSIRQAERRYREMKKRSRQHIFEANFWAKDCTRTRLRDIYPTYAHPFDIVSCQFALHYAFESQSQAECMIKNAAECLRPGGFFIGTTIDSETVLQRLKDKINDSSMTNSSPLMLGNSVFSVTFDKNSPIISALRSEIESNKDLKVTKNFLERIPRYGAQYTFHLTGVVDCPEFLINFDELSDIAERNGMILVAKQGFENYFKCKRKTKEGNNLLGVIKALEPYPAKYGYDLVGTGMDDNYDAAEKYLKKFSNNILDSVIQPDEEPAWVVNDGNSRTNYIGTLSKEEWEAITLYCVFAFKKKDNTK